MARPYKQGLLYFPVDVDFFEERRIKSLKLRYGGNGIMFFIYLLTEIYRNGYYIIWDKDSIENAMEDLRLKENAVLQMMEYLATRSLLIRGTLDGSVTTLSSHGIQKRYQEAVKSLKRDVYVYKEIWLLKDEETAAFIKFTHFEDKSGKNGSKSGGNPGKSGENPVNKIKQNKIKENNNNYNIPETGIFEKSFGYPPSDVEKTMLLSLLSNHDKEIVEYAFFQASQNNRKTLGYVKGVLNNLDKAGVRGMGDLAVYHMKRGEL